METDRLPPEIPVVGLRGEEARKANMHNLSAKLARDIFPVDEDEKRPNWQKNVNRRRIKALQEIVAIEGL